MKTIFLVILLALTMSLPGCVGPGENPKSESANASIELVYSRGFDLKMGGGQETSRLDTNVDEYSREICPAGSGAQVKHINFNFSDSEKKTIYDSLVKNQIWAIDHDFTENCQPDNESWPDRICQSTTPGDYSILQVSWNGQKKTLEWTVDYINSTDTDPQLARYKNFEEDLQKVIDNKIEAMGIDLPGCVYD